MAQLALSGEFRFVPGPIYYKRLHGENMHLKRRTGANDKRQLSWASLAAWMVEVIVPAGPTPEERRQLFDAVLDRFLVPHAPWRWVRAPARLLSSTSSQRAVSAAALLDRIKRNERVRSIP